MNRYTKKKHVSIILCLIVLLFSFFPAASIAAEETNAAVETGETQHLETGNRANEKTTPSGIPLSEVEGFVDGYVDDYIGKTVPGAAIVVLKDNQIVLSKGYGYADIERKIEVNPETTVFEWGSVSKLFVWTSVMQLVEQGKIDLNEDIRTYLPEGFLTKLKYDEPITMLHLMHHNAGFEEYVFDLGYDKPDKVKSLEEGLKLSEPEQVYKPGEVVAYSNFGTALAGFIVERMTGQEFYQYVQGNILEKIGSKDSSIHPTWSDKPELIDNKAAGYTYTEPSQFKELMWFYVSMYPAGSANGPVVDLANFASAFMPQPGEESPLFQKESTLHEMLAQSYTANENIPGIAHGFWEYQGKKRGLTHGGNTAAFSSNLHIVPEENFAVIVLTNQSGEADLCYGLTKKLVGEKEISASAEKLPDPAEVEGTYTMARRGYGGFMNIYFDLLSFKVEALNEREVQISGMGMEGKYVQTSPYVYQKTEGHVMLDAMSPIYVHVKDREPTQISMSITDLLPVGKGKTTPYLIIGVGLLLLSFVYFIIAPFVILVRGIIRKRRKIPAESHQRWNSGIILSGTAIVLNNVLMFLRLMINPFASYSEMVPHIILNYGLTALSVICVGILAVKGRKAELMKGQKFWYGFSAAMTLFLIILMVYWQFYSAT
ncbi:serine hydrolase domain-containing protein [Bacillus benzoevorans]|uniref:CubicO group peptidase (Beta-lactamase class C family) n=1 Tax=Bacillus benzoevorans TaxID=1456 RepID=A0A7X0HTS3_9BACI|nr:serine hydrolase domain-containing protein [Bacillus benzoevorans]MBB6445565.1 CubicO group peptidase (beta-lactamase class C family) [Bacillus benzoevorans]